MDLLNETAKQAQQIADLTRRNERLADLVRYKRHELHTDGLLTDEEYVELLADNKAVARLEGYDRVRAGLKTANHQLAERDAQIAALTNSLQALRNWGAQLLHSHPKWSEIDIGPIAQAEHTLADIPTAGRELLDKAMLVPELVKYFGPFLNRYGVKHDNLDKEKCTRCVAFALLARAEAAMKEPG